MNARVSICMALVVGAAMGLVLSHALTPAQAQAPPARQSQDLAILSLSTQVANLQQRVDVLQVEVNQLKAAKTTPQGSGISPFYQPRSSPRLSNIPPSQITLLGQPTP